jgi:hypothetical protein
MRSNMKAETLRKQSIIWTGRWMSMLEVLALLTDAAVNLLTPEKIAGKVVAMGFKTAQQPALGTIILSCTLHYAIPSTAVLGAILVTGFLGGAICTHYRLGDVLSPPSLVCVALGMLAWGGIYLRDARLRTLLPLTNVRN